MLVYIAMSTIAENPTFKCNVEIDNINIQIGDYNFIFPDNYIKIHKEELKTFAKSLLDVIEALKKKKEEEI